MRRPVPEDSREQDGKVAHVRFPLLLEVRFQPRQRDAAFGEPRPRPVVLPFEDLEQPFLEHAARLPRQIAERHFQAGLMLEK